MAAVARTKWPEAAFYRDYRVMLDEMQSDIDAVIVSTPDHMHAVQTLAAFDLGKHVYCEKPLTHDIAEARRLTEAAARARVVTQMGNQGSSGDSTRLIETWIQEGVIRSEEHTSELQSRENLVCRLLLEKKSSKTNT